MSVADFLGTNPTKSASPKVTPSASGNYASVERNTNFDGLDSKRKKQRGPMAPFASIVDFATGVKDVVFSPGTGMVLCYFGAGSALWSSGISYSLIFKLGSIGFGAFGLSLSIPLGLPIAAVVQLIQMAARMHVYNPELAAKMSISIGTKPIILASESNSKDAFLPEVNKAAKGARKKSSDFVSGLGYALYAIELIVALSSSNIFSIWKGFSISAIGRVFWGVFGVEACLILSKILGAGHLSAKQQRAVRAKKIQAEAKALQNLEAH